MANVTTANRNTLTQAFLDGIAFDGIRVLDLGSRHGENLHHVGTKVKAGALVAIDWHNKTDGDVEFIRKDLEQPLDFEDGSFDVVICNDVLEHVERKQQLLGEIVRIAKKHYVISLPNTQHYRYVRGLKRGDMGKQYVFNQPDGEDRHRWVTFYQANIDFVCSSPGRLVEQWDIIEKSRHRLPYRLFGPTAYTKNQLFVFEKP